MRVLLMTVRVRFAQDTLDALLRAVERNDVVDTHIDLPQRIPGGFTHEQFAQCLNLCRQFWLDGVERARLAPLAHKLAREGGLAEAECSAFKAIRARYKHMGFAFMLYTSAHRRPFLYEATSTLMGDAQDAFGNGYAKRACLAGSGLSVLVSPFFDGWCRTRVRRAVVDRARSINEHMRAETARIPGYLSRPEVTAAQFHALRKIISRRVAFFDTMRTLYPDTDYDRVSRFLSAINGLMGRKHDELVRGALSGTLRYRHDSFPIPQTIRVLLETMCQRDGVQYDGVGGPGARVNG